MKKYEKVIDWFNEHSKGIRHFDLAEKINVNAGTVTCNVLALFHGGLLLKRYSLENMKAVYYRRSEKWSRKLAIEVILKKNKLFYKKVKGE